MNYGPLIFLGAFLVFASAWVGLVFVPSQQMKDLQATQVEGSAVTHPAPYTGQQLEGRKVYQAEGCVYCHTQQVRGGQYNNDVERGWGPRRSVPQDYVYDYPVLLGTMRTGPDLANIGARQPDEQWHLRHLYDPQFVSPGSVMPPYRHLFEHRQIVGQPSPDALKLPYVQSGYEIVPTDKARNLVAYLKSLDRTYEIEQTQPQTQPQQQQTPQGGGGASQ